MEIKCSPDTAGNMLSDSFLNTN